MKEQLENQFRDDFDNLNSKSVQKDAELEDLNRKIMNLKDEIIAWNNQVKTLEEENKNKEIELEEVEEEIKNIYASFFDLYHSKTVYNILILNALYNYKNLQFSCFSYFYIYYLLLIFYFYIYLVFN